MGQGSGGINNRGTGYMQEASAHAVVSVGGNVGGARRGSLFAAGGELDVVG